MEDNYKHNIISDRPIKLPVKIYTVIIVFGVLLIGILILASNLSLSIIKTKDTAFTELFYVKENILEAEKLYDEKLHNLSFKHATGINKNDFPKYYDEAADILEKLAEDKTLWKDSFFLLDGSNILEDMKQLTTLIYQLKEESQIAVGKLLFNESQKTELKKIDSLRKNVNSEWNALFDKSANYFYKQAERLDSLRRLIIVIFSILFLLALFSIYIFYRHRKEDYLKLTEQYEKLEAAYKEIEETKEELHREEERYKLLVMNAPVGIHELNREGKFISLNNHGLKLFSDTFKDLHNIAFTAIVTPQNRAEIREYFFEALDGKEKHFEFVGVSQGEETRYFSSCFIPEKENNGSVSKVIGVTQEITAERNAVLRAQRLQRMYDILSEINHVIVRESVPVELYDKVCKIFINSGNFKLAWVGKVSDGKVESVAFAGEGYNYLRKLEIDLLSKEDGKDNVAKTVQAKEPVIINDILKSETGERWKNYCKEKEFASSASIPIIFDDKVVSVLTVISDKKNYFEEHEAKLMEKIRDDISFAITKYEIENSRNREEEAISQIDSAVASAIGKDFFSAISKEFMKILDAEIAFVGKIIENGKTIQIISGFDSDRNLEGETFELDNSLCNNIINQEKPVEFFNTEQKELKFIKNKKIKSYFGVALYDSNKKVNGILVLIFTKSAENGKLTQTLLHMFSSKIGIELEREDMMNKLLESDNRFNSLLKSSPRGISIFNKDGILLVSNSKWEKLWGIDGKAAVGKYNILTDKKTKEFGLVKEFQKVLNGKTAIIPELEIIDDKSTPANKKYILPNIFTTFNSGNEIEYLIFMLEDITPRRIAETEREKAEQKYIQLFEASNDAIYLVYENKFEMVNKKFIEMFEYSEEEICNEDFNPFMLFDEEGKKMIEERRAKIRRGEKVPSIYEFIAVTKSGKRLKCETSVTYIEYKDGIGVQGIVRDISEREELIKSLKDSINSYEGLFENTVDAIYIQKPTGEFITVNGGAEKMYGYSKEEFIGKTPDFLSAEGMNDFDELGKIIEKAFKGEPQKFPFWGKRKNGEIFPKEVRMHKGKYFDEDVLIVFAQDITDRIEKENKLKASEARYRTLFQSSSDAIVLLKDGIFIDCNDRTLEMFRCKRDQIIGNKPEDFSPALQPEGIESSELINQKLKKCLSGEPQIFEWKYIPLEGKEFDSEVSVTRLDLPQGVYLLMIIRDITQRKIAEMEIRLAKEKAEKASMMKSAFLSQISHEIRTPLGHFRNYFGLLKDSLEGSLPEELNFMFDSLDSSEKRISRTIESIVLSAELSTGTYDFHAKKLNFEKGIIGEIIGEFKSEAQSKKIGLKISGSLDGKMIFYDEQALKWILKNLIDNAIKYTQEGKVEINYGVKGKRASIEVADTGIGIKKEYLERLFSEPFSQVDSGYTRKFDGNGLGLWMTKALCDLGGASINVKTKVSAGTTFTVDFPITES